MLPISVAGGFGIREISAVTLFATLGISKEHALLYALIHSFRWLFWAFLGGFYELIEKALEKDVSPLLAENS